MLSLRRCAVMVQDGRCSGSCQIACVFSFAESSEEELDNEPVLCHDSCGHMFTAEFADKVFNLEEAYRLDAGGAQLCNQPDAPCAIDSPAYEVPQR